MSDEHRSSPRYNLSSIKAMLGDVVCEVIDVSPSGIFLKGVGAELERGDVVSVTLSLPLMGHIVSIQIDGFVIRNDDKGIAIDYAKPTITWPHVLRVLDLKEHRED